VNEKLLREVIARVLSDPNIQGLLQGASPKIIPEKPKCLVLVEGENDLRTLPDVERRYCCDFDLQLCIVGDGWVQTDSSLSLVSWEKAKEQSTWARIVIPVCSSGQLAQIALGLSLDKVSELTSWAIKQNIPVEIGLIKDEFTERTPQAYRDLFAGYFQQATAYGVVIGEGYTAAEPSAALQPVTASVAPLLTIDSSDKEGSDLVPWSFSVDSKTATSTPGSRSKLSFTKRLFSAKEAMTLPPYTVLQVAKGTVLTPSALDTLKNNKVEVVREGVKYL
jgi:hypothetical protein